MSRIISTGEQYFINLRRDNAFYIDKTKFIKDWWDNCDPVTLITRPRRFGKTLMLDTVKTFFSPEFAGQSELFEGLEIWDNEKFRTLQGTIPVIFLSFADLKSNKYPIIRELINDILVSVYDVFKPKLELSIFTDTEKKQLSSVTTSMSDATAQTSLRHLAKYVARQYSALPIILLDEYDTPMHEAWINGYWQELVDFMRGFLNSTFKTNSYLCRGLITGTTRVAKESIFSDFNNLEVITTTSDFYTDCFGFTEIEVFSAMDEYGLSDKETVKKWYDGFIFGSQKGIYNPWSIINYLKKKKFAPYWADTSSNALVGELIAQANEEIKYQTLCLLKNKSIITKIDEKISFSDLFNEQCSIWNFLIAAGYVKHLSFNLETDEFEIKLTNYEVNLILNRLISRWFNKPNVQGNKFRQALLTDNLEYMNKFLSEIAKNTFSFFDTSGEEPERFYHAFVLGLLVDLKDQYEITSNRESGFGRYDVIMFPKSRHEHAIVIEFKTLEKNTENSLNDAALNALKQIKEKEYLY